MILFPFYKQYDSMQCGIACMAMICKYYGKGYSYDTLSRQSTATTEGMSLLDLKKIGEEVGMKTLCGRVNMSQITEVNSPCILHWNQNHFVVLYKVKAGKKYYIADPGKGLVKYSLEEFKSHWISTRSNGEEKGIAMFLEPTPSFYSHKEDGEGEKNKNPRSFRFLFGYVKKYRRYFGQIVLGLIVGSLPSAIPSR